MEGIEKIPALAPADIFKVQNMHIFNRLILFLNKKFAEHYRGLPFKMDMAYFGQTPEMRIETMKHFIDAGWLIEIVGTICTISKAKQE